MTHYSHGRAKSRLVAAGFSILFLWAAPACAAAQRHHYGHLPIHARGTLHGGQAHEDVFHGRAGQRIHIEFHSSRPNWLLISVTPFAAKTPIYSSAATRGWSSDVTLPHEGAYRLSVAIRSEEARRSGARVEFKVDVTAVSRLAAR